MTARLPERFGAMLLSLAIALSLLMPGSLSAYAASALRISSTVSSSSSYIGGTVKLKTAAAGGKSPYRYKFVYKIGSGSWKTIKNFSTASSASMKTQKAGKYTFRCYLKDKTNLQVYCDVKLEIKEKYVELSNKSTIGANTVKLDKTVKITGKANGGTKPYKYAYYYKTQDGTEKTAKGFSKTASFTIKLPSAGYYSLRCVVKDADNMKVSKSFSVVVTNKMGSVLKNNSVVSAASVKKNSSLTITGKSSGGYQPCTYAFSYSLNGGSYVSIRDYGKSAVKSVKFKEPGYYKIRIQAKDQAGKIVNRYRNVVVTNDTAKTLTNKSTISTTSLVSVGTTITLKGAAANGVQPYEYAYYYKHANGSWQTIRDFSTSQGASLKASKSGAYSVKIAVRDYKGTVKNKIYTVESLPDNVGNDIPEDYTINLDYGLSTPITAEDAGSGAEYAFYYKKTGDSVWTSLQGYSENRFARFRPRYTGTYNVLVYTQLNGRVSSDVYLVNADISDQAYEELRIINEERQKAGVDTLVLDPELTFAAGVRAEELEEYYSHTRPDGRSCFTVLDDYGIDYPGIVGENIASGYRAVEPVMTGWMNSKGHRENILNESYKKVGVGINTRFWSQMFSD